MGQHSTVSLLLSTLDVTIWTPFSLWGPGKSNIRSFINKNFDVVNTQHHYIQLYL